MKSLIASSTLFLVLIIFSFSSYIYIDNKSEDITKRCDRLYLNVKNEQWSLAVTEVQKVNTMWKELEGLVSLIEEHSEIDEINLSLAAAETYIDTKDNDEACESIRRFSLLIHHIPKKNQLSLLHLF